MDYHFAVIHYSFLWCCLYFDSTGELVNIMSTDTSEVIDFTCTILVVFAIPITVFYLLLSSY